LIVDAAERLLSEHDPLLVTFEQVAEEAGVSRPLVHAYLGDRRGLIDAVQVRIVERLDTWVGHGLGRADTTDEGLRALVHAAFAFVTEERNAWRILGATGGFDHPALHALRTRWVTALTISDDPAGVGAQAVVAAVLAGVGTWVRQGIEPAAVIDRLRPLLMPLPQSVSTTG
jgi:AcrR family transcriptional regulator